MIRKQRSSLDIDESLNEMRQDEPRLIEILRKHYLYPPSESPYNFSNPYPDLKGQVLQALFIYEDFFKGKNVRTTTKLFFTNKIRSLLKFYVKSFIIITNNRSLEEKIHTLAAENLVT